MGLHDKHLDLDDLLFMAEEAEYWKTENNFFRYWIKGDDFKHQWTAEVDGYEIRICQYQDLGFIKNYGIYYDKRDEDVAGFISTKDKRVKDFIKKIPDINTKNRAIERKKRDGYI